MSKQFSGGQSSPLPLTKHTRYVVVKTIIIKILTASMWLFFYTVTCCGVYLNCWHYKLDAWYYHNRYTSSSQYYHPSLHATKFIHAERRTLLHHPLVTAESLLWGTADTGTVLSFEWVQCWAIAMVIWNMDEPFGRERMFWAAGVWLGDLSTLWSMSHTSLKWVVAVTDAVSSWQ